MFRGQKLWPLVTIVFEIKYNFRAKVEKHLKKSKLQYNWRYGLINIIIGPLNGNNFWQISVQNSQ